MKQTNSEKELKEVKEKLSEEYSEKVRYRKEYYKEEKKNSNLWMFLIISIFLLIGTNMIAYGRDLVDEDKLCLEKINTYFLEYKFSRAEYQSNNERCIGFYTEGKEIKRDGLILQNDKKELSKEFKVIGRDLEILEKDNFYEGMNFFGWIIAFSGTGLTLWFKWMTE